MPDKKLCILRMKDEQESHYVDKGLMWNLPMKLIIIGRSQLSGKTNLMGSLLLQEDSRMYRHEFKGEDIYLFSPSADGSDHKLTTIINEKEIPRCNVYPKMDLNVVSALYDNVQEAYLKALADKRKPVHSLFIFDDLAQGNQLKNGMIEKLCIVGRHILISTIMTSQKYTLVPTVARENATGMVLFNSTDKQLDLISEDNNYFPKKNDFKDLYRKLTMENHSFMCVNYSNSAEQRYQNKNFECVHSCGELIEVCNCPKT
tara:strand:- start:1208 stop:1984 length:777 start_codon:yes stop_codon:yes gene_type:complete